jgi:hypothetical protein
VEIEAIADQARLVDLRGTERLVEAQDGRYLIDLPPALCIQTIGDYCMIGGSTFYLIQALDGGAPPQGTAPVLPQPTITPTPLATATSLPTVTPTPSPTPELTPSPLPPTPAVTTVPLSTAVLATQVSEVVDMTAVPLTVAESNKPLETSAAGSWTPVIAGIGAVGVLVVVVWWLFRTREG